MPLDLLIGRPADIADELILCFFLVLDPTRQERELVQHLSVQYRHLTNIIHSSLSRCAQIMYRRYTRREIDK
jgi:hypothetical protein